MSRPRLTKEISWKSPVTNGDSRRTSAQSPWARLVSSVTAYDEYACMQAVLEG
jgi:hypothetical protein